MAEKTQYNHTVNLYALSIGAFVGVLLLGVFSVKDMKDVQREARAIMRQSRVVREHNTVYMCVGKKLPHTSSLEPAKEAARNTVLEATCVPVDIR